MRHHVATASRSANDIAGGNVTAVDFLFYGRYDSFCLFKVQRVTGLCRPMRQRLRGGGSNYLKMLETARLLLNVWGIRDSGAYEPAFRTSIPVLLPRLFRIARMMTA
jgi:hypothetical protein